MIDHHLYIDSDMSLEKSIELIRGFWERGVPFEVHCKEIENQRTPAQQASIEIYCRKVAKALNDAGIDKREFYKRMKEGIRLPNTQESIKEDFWKFIQDSMLGKKSTKKLSTKEVSLIYEAMNQACADTFGISLPFPDRFTQMEDLS